MYREVVREVKRKLTRLFILSWLLVTAGLIFFAVYRSQSYIFKDWLDYFTFILEDPLSITFPIIVVLVYLYSYSQSYYRNLIC